MQMLLRLETRLANLLNISEKSVISTIKLLDDGATVPFIARYRKEITGGLDDNILRTLAEKLIYFRELDNRRQTILNSISEQGKLTPELSQQILAADNKTALEDLYLPYKPRRRTKAQIAKDAGLEPLSMTILNNPHLAPEELAIKYLNHELGINTLEDALDGAKYILMEQFSEHAVLLGILRSKLFTDGLITSKLIKGQEEKAAKFQDYFNHQELIKNIPSHRALAILRGVNEKFLRISIEYPEQSILAKNNLSSYEEIIIKQFKIPDKQKSSIYLLDCVKSSWKTKIYPSLETELISEMKEYADTAAIKVFATNLHNLLLMPPAGSKTTLGLDPGIRTGVKCAVVDSTGKLIATDTVYPFTKNINDAKAILAKLINNHDVELISIGNGTASRETEDLAKGILKDIKNTAAKIIIVSEAGASVYSASEFAAKEFPNLDVSIRGAVSIARRLQDPLAELVKIDPKSIGVGQYQHDVNQNALSKSLDIAVEDCVNAIGVDVNTASIPLLSKISGLNATIATNIVEYRNNNGMFTTRNSLKKVARLGDKAFEQSAGFLRILNGKNPLDKSGVHPESYEIVSKIALVLNIAIDKLIGNTDLLTTVTPADFVTSTHGVPTITDILKELDKPGRDPRGELVVARFIDGVNKIEDVSVGMEMDGVVTNVANFGAFIDIGVHQDGLVHISKISDKFITNPNDMVKVGQVVRVRVEEIDVKRKRISLSMKNLNKHTL